MRTSDAIALAPPPAPSTPTATVALCDVCGSPRLQEIRCKIVCRNCGTILQSCADL